MSQSFCSSGAGFPACPGPVSRNQLREGRSATERPWRQKPEYGHKQRAIRENQRLAFR
jgi:hypothetical protein